MNPSLKTSIIYPQCTVQKVAAIMQKGVASLTIFYAIDRLNVIVVLVVMVEVVWSVSVGWFVC